MGSDPGPTLGCGLGGFGSGQATLFQEHEGQAAELLPVVAGDDGLLVGLGDGHRIAHTQFALFDQHGVAEGKELGVVGQPVGNLDAGDLGAAVEVVEVAPLLAGGQDPGRSAPPGGWTGTGANGVPVPAGPRTVPSLKPATPSQVSSWAWRAVQSWLESASLWSQSMRRTTHVSQSQRARGLRCPITAKTEHKIRTPCLLRPQKTGRRVLFHLSKQRLVVGQPGVAFLGLESPI